MSIDQCANCSISFVADGGLRCLVTVGTALYMCCSECGRRAMSEGLLGIPTVAQGYPREARQSVCVSVVEERAL